ncbi:hypothetical protein CHUAL_005910 [Chamberlinius hualienensis]
MEESEKNESNKEEIQESSLDQQLLQTENEISEISEDVEVVQTSVEAQTVTSSIIQLQQGSNDDPSDTESIHFSSNLVYEVILPDESQKTSSVSLQSAASNVILTEEDLVRDVIGENSMNFVYPVSEGRKVVTVPMTIDGQVQQVEVEVPGWAEISDHNLVAMTEDGSTVPLTVVEQPVIENEIQVQVENVSKPKPKSLRDVMALMSGPRKKAPQVTKQAPDISQTKLKTPLKLNRRLVVKKPPDQNNSKVPSPKIEIKTGKERENCKIELSNTTQSTISTENMQTLIQILQALPTSSRNQTVRIILQNETADGEEAVTTTHTIVSQQEKTKNTDKSPSLSKKQTKIHNVTTSEIGCQVSPESLLEAEKQTVEQEEPQPESVSALPSSPQPDKSEICLEKSVTQEPEVPGPVEEGEESVKSVNRNVVKKFSKIRASKVITLEQQWVVDPQPGVSYYAVVDYLSEHEHDGYASGSELRRPQAPFSAFMEDYLELQEVSDDARNGSVLESTLDGSLFVSPYRKSKLRLDYENKSEVNKINESIDLPKSAVTSKEVTMTDGECEIDSDAEVTTTPSTATVVPSAAPVTNATRKLRSRAPRVRYQHCCGYCSYGSREKLLVVEHCILEHPNEPVKTLSLLKGGILTGRVCPYCRQTFESHEFFSHMRFAHNEVHPFKCGYCDFMGRDKNQIRHHIQKKHKLPIKIINLKNVDKSGVEGEDGGGGDGGGVVDGKRRIMGSGRSGGCFSEGDDSVYEYMTDEDEEEADDVDNQKPMHCPECKKPFKTLKYLKTHIKIHQPLRYQCGYCDFTTVMLHQVIRHCQSRHSDCEPKVLTKELEPEKNPIVSKDIESVKRQVHAFNTRLPRDPDGSKWMRKWCCPHCDYTCQFGASYRRHLRMHANVLPYKCNYCSFKGREKYYVRRHINRMHKGIPMIVIENTPENCQNDSSSDEGYQEKGLRRKRRRKMKRLKPVVPVDVFGSNVGSSDKYQKLPVGERGMKKRKVTDEPPSDHRKTSEDGTGRQTGSGNLYPRLPRAKEWSGENISDYIESREGDKIICKVCGQKTLSKAFYKHARKHFRVKPFKCGYCNYMSVERAKIRVHNTLKHPNAPFRIEECHLASILPREFMDLIGDNEASSVPNASETFFGDQQNQQPSNSDQQSEIIQVPLLETPQFNCPLCQQLIYYEESALREHFYVHYDYLPFICSCCDFRATTSEKIVEHGTETHPEEEVLVYAVDEAKPEGLEETIMQHLSEGEAVVQQRLLEIIEQTTAANQQQQLAKDDKNEEQELFQCPICEKKMNLHVSTIRRHLYSHHKYKPFKCGYCEFQAVSKANIKQHTVTHGSISPVIEVLKDLPMPEDLLNLLKQLQNTLKMTLIDLNSHQTTVSQELNVEENLQAQLERGECPACPENLDPNNLHAHLLSHFNNFICGHCQEKFNTSEEAEIHHQECHATDEHNILISSNLSEENSELCQTALKLVEKQSKNIEYQVVIVADDKETVIPVTKMDPRDDDNQGYALVLEQDEDGTVKAAKMIKDSPDVISTQQMTNKNYTKSEVLNSSEIVEETDEETEDSDDDIDIVTVGGVLLTRSYRSEVEAESSGDESDDSKEEELEPSTSLSLKMNVFECEICDQTFNKTSELAKHITETHGIQTVDELRHDKDKEISSSEQNQSVEIVELDKNEEEEEEETVENIRKMIQSSVNEDETESNLNLKKRKASEEVLEDCSNAKQRKTEPELVPKMKECDENLPKILSILQLKPSKKNSSST